jgi:hypothetical protein
LSTAAESWESCALDVPELADEPDEGVEELLDEHAASSIAAPAATAPYATRDARGLRLDVLMSSMRPHIFSQEVRGDHATDLDRLDVDHR